MITHLLYCSISRIALNFMPLLMFLIIMFYCLFRESEPMSARVFFVAMLYKWLMFVCYCRLDWFYWLSLSLCSISSSMASWLEMGSLWHHRHKGSFSLSVRLSFLLFSENGRKNREWFCCWQTPLFGVCLLFVCFSAEYLNVLAD